MKAAADTTPVGSLRVDSSARVAIGQQLGRYVVIEVLGHGAMGEVLRAYDPKLRRELAIKRILPTTLSAEAEARLVREAQAMAQLGHPNVVAVYDVDVTDKGVLVAMEYVRGTTLEKWLRSKPDWRAILPVFVQAGHGLQAAHRSGLVHRDFKPANALVDDEGRVRVADFGLVRVVAPDRSSLDKSTLEDEERSVPAFSSLDTVDPKLTDDDIVLGTPRYMAPEQHLGPAVEASDQFAFCVALWEALVGRPPYRGNSLAEIAAAKHDGPPPWPRTIAIPRRIVAAIERGLAPRPEDRFPSMQALLDRLAPDLSARRRTIVLSAAVVVVGGAGLLAWQLREAKTCTGAESLIETSWGADQRQRVELAFVATGVATAEAARGRVVETLDAFAQEWAAQHRETCEATTIRGEQSSAVMDLRMACLGRARGELNAIVGVFQQADVKTVERAHRLLESLPALDRCEDVAALKQDVAPPPAGPTADAVAAAREDLARSRALYRIGKYDESLALADDVDARTRDLSYPPIHAEAALGRGDVLDYLGRYDDSEAALRRSLQIALREGSYDVAIKAAASLVYIVGYLGRPAEAQWPAHLALDLAHRIGAEPEIEARARNALGHAYRLLSKWDESETEYREGIRRLAQAVGEKDGRVATLIGALGALLTEAGRFDVAEVELRRAYELRRSVLGPRHPDTALSSQSLAYVVIRLGRFDDAEALLREGLAVRIEAHGPDHFFVAKIRADLALALTYAGRIEEALAELQTAVGSLEASLPTGHSGFIDVLHIYALTLVRAGRLDEAEVQARRALTISEASYGADHPLFAEELDHVARMAIHRDALDEAEASAARAIAIYEGTRGTEHLLTMNAKATLGATLLARGDRERARPVLEQVWAFREHAAVAPHDKAESAFALARAIATSDRDRPDRAVALAQRAQAEYRRAGAGFTAELTSVEDWLAR